MGVVRAWGGLSQDIYNSLLGEDEARWLEVVTEGFEEHQQLNFATRSIPYLRCAE